MQESKYYYEGIPLTQYCKEHEINVTSIRTRVWKKRNSPKYENYSDQEIVNMVVKAYGTSVKYMYGDKTLRQYCMEKGLVFGTITSRINSLKKKNPNLTNDELVKLAVDEFENNNFTLFYDGMPLKDYCKEHPEINYNTIRGYIAREKEKDPSKTTEELVEQYIAKEHYGRYKYYYCGIPLVTYCEEHNISVDAIKGRLYRYRKNHPGISDDELVNAVMDEYEPFMPKYMYLGMTLSKYCKTMNISYYSVVSFVKRRLAINKNLNIDKLIDEGIKTIKRYGIIYYYDGIPLKDYARLNGINASSIRASILRKKSKSNKCLQEIVNECVLAYQEFKVKYFYHGESLLSFCKRVGINYNTVIHKYLDQVNEDENIDVSKKIEEIVDYMLAHPRVRTKYYYGEDSLSKYCKKSGYSYNAVYQRLKALEEKYVYDTQEEAVVDAVDEYRNKKLRDAFKILSNRDLDLREEDIKTICSILNIDILNVYDLSGMDFDYEQIINMIWYFANDYDEDNKMYLSDKRIEELFEVIDKVSVLDKKIIKDIDFLILFGLYKSRLIDTREYMLEQLNQLIFKTINELCSSYKIKPDIELLDDLAFNARIFLLASIDQVSFSNKNNILDNVIFNMKLLLKEYIEKLKQKDYKLEKK